MKANKKEIQNIIHNYICDFLKYNEAILPSSIAYVEGEIDLYYPKFYLNELSQITFTTIRKIDNSFSDDIINMVKEYIKENNIDKDFAIELYKVDFKLLMESFNNVATDRLSAFDDLTCKSIFISLSDYALASYYRYLYRIEVLKVNYSLEGNEKILWKNFVKSVFVESTKIYNNIMYSKVLLSKLINFNGDEIKEVFKNFEDIFRYRLKYNEDIESLNTLRDAIENFLLINSKYNKNGTLYVHHDIESDVYVTNIF